MDLGPSHSSFSKKLREINTIFSNKISTMNKKITIYKTTAYLMLIICLLSPLNTIHTETFCICVVLLIPFFIKKYRHLDKNERKLITSSSIFLLVVVFYKIFGISSCSNDNIAVYINWTVVLLISVFFQFLGFTIREKRFLLYILYLLIMIQELEVFIVGYSALTKGIDDISGIRITEFGSMVMFFSFCCLIWFLHDKSFINRCLSLFGVGISLYINIFIMQRAINLLSMLFGLLYIILCNSKKSYRNNLILFVSFIIIFIVLYFQIYISIIDQFSSTLKSIRLFERLQDLKDFLITGDFTETGRFSGRIPLLMNSFNSWIKTPISFLFGVGDHRGNDSIIGNHSEYIDCLGRYGLVGGILLLIETVYLVKYVISFYQLKKDRELYYQSGIVVFLYVIRNFLGIVSIYQVGIPMLIFLPLLIDVCCMCRKETNEGIKIW